MLIPGHVVCLPRHVQIHKYPVQSSCVATPRLQISLLFQALRTLEEIHSKSYISTRTPMTPLTGVVCRETPSLACKEKKIRQQPMGPESCR